MQGLQVKAVLRVGQGDRDGLAGACNRDDIGIAQEFGRQGTVLDRCVRKIIIGQQRQTVAGGEGLGQVPVGHQPEPDQQRAQALRAVVVDQQGALQIGLLQTATRDQLFADMVYRTGFSSRTRFHSRSIHVISTR